MKLLFGWKDHRFEMTVLNKNGLRVGGLSLGVADSAPVREAMTYGTPGKEFEINDFKFEAPTAHRDGISEIDHLLICLAEEAAEVSLACSKALRFGLDDNFTDKSPRKMIWLELNDIAGVVAELAQRDVIGASPDPNLVAAKREKLAKMLEYARQKGTLRVEPKIGSESSPDPYRGVQSDR